MSDLKSQVNKILDQAQGSVLVDYFSWGRDPRHTVDNTERLPTLPFSKGLIRRSVKRLAYSILHSFNSKAALMARFERAYAPFEETYQLMSDEYSKNLFAELIAMRLVSEKNLQLSSFTKEFVDSYEIASDLTLKSTDEMSVYKWILRKVTIDHPAISFFTVPTILNLHLTGKLYRYQNGNVVIEVEPGDTVIDAGVGWGDTTIYLAALAADKTGGRSYAFEILEEGMRALSEQCACNPHLKNVTPVLKALSDQDGAVVHISSPGPGASVVEEDTGRRVETVTIDTFVREQNLCNVDFIKMDIEGAEIPALRGGTKAIRQFKPKLAISAYHKWDDLLTIPRLVHSVRSDYAFYLDCTTGFGGETILYCK